MSRLIAIQGCVAVLSAFLLGPFTHVHQAAGHDSDDCEDMTIVHSHVALDVLQPQVPHETSIGRPRHGEGYEISIFDFQKAVGAQTPQVVALFVHRPECLVRGSTPEMPEAVAHAPPAFDDFGLRSPPA